jgi:hypothetical protein
MTEIHNKRAHKNPRLHAANVTLTNPAKHCLDVFCFHWQYLLCMDHSKGNNHSSRGKKVNTTGNGLLEPPLIFLWSVLLFLNPAVLRLWDSVQSRWHYWQPYLWYWAIRFPERCWRLETFSVLTAFRKGIIPPKRPQTYRDLHDITSQKTFPGSITWRGKKRRIQGFGGEPRGKNHLGDPGVDGRIILRWIFRFHKMLGISWLAETWLASQEGLCSMG